MFILFFFKIYKNVEYIYKMIFKLKQQFIIYLLHGKIHHIFQQNTFKFFRFFQRFFVLRRFNFVMYFFFVLDFRKNIRKQI